MRTVIIDHWPPTGLELSDAFYSIEREGHPVTRLEGFTLEHLRQTLPDRGVTTLWGLKLRPHPQQEPLEIRVVGPDDMGVVFRRLPTTCPS